MFLQNFLSLLSKGLESFFIDYDNDIYNLFCHSELAKNLTLSRQKPIMQILRKLMAAPLRMTKLDFINL